MATKQSAYDFAIIGGGPTGLAAAIYAGREGMSTVVLDQGPFGGMAAITDLIENYPGFPDGIGGIELIEAMTKQSERFGAESAPFNAVTALSSTKDGCILELGTTKIEAKAVLIATGSLYRKLEVPGEAELIGRGVHFCATCDGPLYRDKELITIGGGNSSLQESLFLARFAKSVHVLVRGSSFKGSDILVRQLEAEPNVTISYDHEVTALTRTEERGPITATVRTSDGSTEIVADGIFVFVGLLPNTHHLANAGLDQDGFVMSGGHYDTHLTGVYVAGDVRSGSTWQIASAVGEGVSAALEVRSYLDTTYPDWHRKANERTTPESPTAV